MWHQLAGIGADHIGLWIGGKLMPPCEWRKIAHKQRQNTPLTTREFAIGQSDHNSKERADKLE